MTSTVVVGAGQAGLALSYHLSSAGHEHVVLERGRVGESWHGRWDSLTLLSPNWMNRLPGGAAHDDPNGFLGREEFIAYLEAYAASFAAPVVAGVDVTMIERDGTRFRLSTTDGEWVARSVVLAAGDAAFPHVPFAAPRSVTALHAAEYRRPALLPDGPVLVVGAGASGQQLALELQRAGRDVVLAVGRHSRAPRSYRGRDIFEWLDVLGDFDRTVDELADLEAAKRVPLFPVSGSGGGEDLGLDRLEAEGVTLAGRLLRFDGSRAVFGDGLADDVASANARLRKLQQRIDAHPLAQAADAEPLPDVVVQAGARSADLRRFGAVVWATGYRSRYPWLRIGGVLDSGGGIVQRNGATRVPRLYVLGLAYQYRRSSHFIGGVGRDAETVARRILADEYARVAA